MVDDDKYPPESGRRRFVKGVVGSAALAGIGTGTAATLNSATSPSGAGGGPTQYIGIENTDGPAPRGMPIIPVEITDGGELTGLWPSAETRTSGGREIAVAETDVGGVTYSSTWFQYCGVQTYEGTQPEAEQDNVFRVASGSPYDWQDQESGTPLTVEMFDDYEEYDNGIGTPGLGKPAMGRWRSEGDVKTLPVQVLRSTEVSRMAGGEGPYSDLPGQVRNFVDAATEQDFIAWLDKCTHFCCVPGFKAFPSSAKFEAENRVYCQCHQSVYDPFSPVLRQFIALPRPDE